VLASPLVVFRLVVVLESIEGEDDDEDEDDNEDEHNSTAASILL
jgi:hypothetical protein